MKHHDDESRRPWLIGHLRSGNEVLEKHSVHMPSDLVGNRLAVFAQSGFGKTNAAKVILWGAIDEPYGKLVFDRRGEYVPDTTNEYGEEVPGLAHHPVAHEKLVLYTNKKSVLANQSLRREVHSLSKFGVKIVHIPPGELVSLYPNLTNPQREFLYVYEDNPEVYESVMDDESNWHRTLTDWFGQKDATKKLDYSAAIVVRSVRKKLVSMHKRPFVEASGNSIQEILDHLRQGRTVVVDLSGYISELDRTFIATLIARKLFEYNLERLDVTDPMKGKIKTVIVFEEAQTLLATERLSEGSMFVNIAKEGRALEIGLVAITQQPSAISTRVLSQFNSFLALHLEFMDDIQFLKKVAGSFEGLEMDIRRKIPGNAYLVTRLKPFAIPLRVFHFNRQFLQEQAASATRGIG
jgi:DNA helicase HerA-like ATPase